MMPASKSRLLTRIPGVTIRDGRSSRSAFQRFLPAVNYYSQSTLLLSSKDDRPWESSQPDPKSNNNTNSTDQKKDWRKRQLEALEQKFQPGDWPVLPNMKRAESLIQDDEDLQPMWKDMESRVKNRRSRTLEENKGKIGRSNVRKTDEDVWLEQGLYEVDNNDDDDNDDKDTRSEK